MANVSKLFGLTGKVLGAAKRVTLPPKATKGLIFGAGALTGSVATYSLFAGQRPTTSEPQQVASKPAAPKAEAKKEPEFEYAKPKIGEDGIVKADTSYYAGTKQPEVITYMDKDGDPVRDTELNKQGKLKGFTIYGNGGYDHYDAKGERDIKTRKGSDESWTMDYKSEHGSWLRAKYDAEGRPVHHEFEHKIDDNLYVPAAIDYTYHKDGSVTTRDSRLQTEETVDKNGKTIKEKKYDDKGVLEYTVVPKYNKDGDVIKNDTIRNK